MEKTWASGALELLKHADSHIQQNSAFDKRIAFISIDNSIETSIRTFLSMPTKLSGVKFPKKEIDDAGNNFPKMVELLFKYASSKLTGLDDGDIEHYHRIRNKLYHDGTGLSVDKNYLLAYRQIAAILLNNLFAVSVKAPSREPTLENLILLWNEVVTLLKSRLREEGHEITLTSQMYIFANDLLSAEEYRQLIRLRDIRNAQVHSHHDSLDKKRLALGVELAETLIEKLKG